MSHGAVRALGDSFPPNRPANGLELAANTLVTWGPLRLPSLQQTAADSRRRRQVSD